MNEEPEYAFKGVWIPREIWLSEDITWMEKCLLAEIDALDAGEGCYASNDHLAQRFGSSGASVANQISKLRGLGYLETRAFNGRKRWLKVKADLTAGLSQDQPPDEGGINPDVIPYSRVSTKAKREPITPQSFMAAWNSLPDPFVRMRVMSSGRVTNLRARSRDEFWAENWQAAIQRLSDSDFAKGKNARGWVADVEFFLRPDTVAKTMEGKYDNKGARPHSSNGLVEDFSHLIP